MSLFVIKDRDSYRFDVQLLSGSSLSRGNTLFFSGYSRKSANFILDEVNEGERERKKSTRIWRSVEAWEMPDCYFYSRYDIS